MPLTIACHQCGQHYSVEEQYAGQQVSCPMCGRLIAIPASPLASPNRGPHQVPNYYPEPEPPSGGRGGMAALLLSLLVVFVFAGGLIGFVVWLSRQEGEQVASNDPPPPVKKEKPRPTPREEKPKPPPRVEEPDEKKVEKKIDPQPRPGRKLPPPSDRPWQGHLAPVLAVAVDPAGKSIWTAAGGADDASLRRWDATTGKETARLEFMDAGLSAAAFDAACARAAVAAPGKTTVEVWDLSAKKKLATLDEHIKPARCLALSPDGKRLVTVGDDKLVIVWDVDAARMLHKLIGHTNLVNAVAVSADGRQALTASTDHTARLWDVGRGELLRELTGHDDAVWAAAFSRDRRWMMTGGGMQKIAEDVYVAGARDHEVRCWDAGTLKEKKRLKPLAEPVTALCFSPDGRRYLAGGNDGGLSLRQTETDKEVKRLDQHSRRVRAVAFFPDGRRAVSAGDDRTFRVHDLPPDLPDLVRDLESDDAKVRLAALAELARLGEEAKPAVLALFKALARKDEEWRGRVLSVLRALSPLDREHVPRLERLLGEKGFTAGRLFALDEFARMGQEAKPAAKTILSAVGDDSVEVRRKALAALTPILDEVSREAFKPLLAALRDRDRAVRESAEKAMEKLGTPSGEHLGTLRGLLGEEGVSLKRFALKALGEMGGAAAAAAGDIGDRARRDSSAEVRREALAALAKVAPKDERTVSTASKALEDSDAGVARQAAKALAGAGDVPGLLAALGHSDEEVVRTADEALKLTRFTEKHVPRLTELVGSKRVEVRRRAIESLAGMGADAAAAVPAISKALKAGEDEEQRRILAALSKMGKAASEAGPAVAELLKAKDRARRYEVCQVLIKIEAKEVTRAVAGLVGQLRAEDAEELEDEEEVKLREKARALLVQIGKPAVPALLRALTEDFSGGKGVEAVLNATARLAAVKALAEMGPAANGTETLRVLAAVRKNDPFSGVRDAARVAYVKVQRKE